MQPGINLVSPPQHESLVDLLCELHAFYNEGSTVDRAMVRSYLLEDLLSQASGLQLLVAYDETQHVLGFAAISLTYSLVEPAPDRRRHCWLKELYVREPHRSQGVGEALMAWVARYAVENACCRIDWPVKAANTRGIAFYERLGAKLVEDRLAYRLSEPSLGSLAGRGVGEA
jgi:GNAT superfamily N-acetyltransferase